MDSVIPITCVDSVTIDSINSIDSITTEMNQLQLSINATEEAVLNPKLLPVMPIRRKVFYLFLDVYSKVFISQAAFKYAINTEKLIYNFTIRKGVDNFKCVEMKYRQKARSLYVNLKPDSYIKNPQLLQMLIDKKITLKYLVNEMSPQEMFPEKWAKAIREIEIDEAKILIRDHDEVIADGMFTCGKCRSKKTTYYQLQTRSADEPMTTFVECINCGSRWKC